MPCIWHTRLYLLHEVVESDAIREIECPVVPPHALRTIVERTHIVQEVQRIRQ